MTPLVCNGWTIYFHQLFDLQFQELISEVKALSSKLPRDKYLKHSSVKRLKALQEGIKAKIPSDPFASHFALQGSLQRYCRLKKMGLNERYRLFFKPFRERRIIIILWLGYPRKDGDKKDCYAVLKKKVEQGIFSENIDELLSECELD